MRFSATPKGSKRSVTLDWIFPFDSFEMDPIEYKHPRAVGASLPPKITLALSVMLTAGKFGTF